MLFTVLLFIILVKKAIKPKLELSELICVSCANNELKLGKITAHP